MRLSTAQIDELIDATRGTCTSLEQECENLFGVEPSELENEMEVLQAIDNAIFCCERCSWWCEMSEMSYEVDWTCTDCHKDGEDE